VVYLQNCDGGGGGEDNTQTHRNKNNEAKAHWSPRWPNNNIRKKYGKSTMKCERLDCDLWLEGMF
jgi:hypothetical protein